MRKHRALFAQDKGHQGEIEAFINAIAAGRELPFGFDEYAMSMLATFKVLDSISAGKPVALDWDELVDNSEGSEDCIA